MSSEAISMGNTPVNTDTFLRRPTLDQMSPEFLIRCMHIYVSLCKAKEDRKRLLELNPAPAGLIRTYDQLIASLEKSDGSA